MSKKDMLRNAGGGSAFGSLGQGGAEQRRQDAAARSEALDATGRARRSSSVPVEWIIFNPLNPRKTVKPESVTEMANSFQLKGQITPITVVSREAFLDAHPDFDPAELGEASLVALDGNRRLRAAIEAGLERVRVDLNDDLAPTASGMLEAALIANIHREDVPPIEEAEAIQELLDAVYGGNQAAVARALGKSPQWVGQRLALLYLNDELQEQVESKQLDVKTARKIGAATRAGKLAAEDQAAAAAAAATAAKPARNLGVEPSARPAEVGSGVNPVYPSAPAEQPPAQRTAPPDTVPASAPTTGDGVNPVYTQAGTKPSGADPAEPGLVSLTVDPSDVDGFAKAIRSISSARQATALVRSLINLLETERGVMADDLTA